MRTFEPARFLAYLRFDVASRRQEALLPLLVPPFLVILWASLRLLSGRPFESWPTGPFVVGLLLAIGAASSAHARDKDALTAPFYLQLPVSHAERFASRLLLGAVLPFLGQWLTLTLLANLLAGVSVVVVGAPFPGVLWPGWETTLSLGGLFLLAHSVFFAGGIFFRASPFVKTAFAASGYAFVLGVTALVLMASGLAQKASIPEILGSVLGQGDVGLSQGLATLAWITRLAWCGVLPVLLYTAAAARAREAEVRG